MRRRAAGPDPADRPAVQPRQARRPVRDRDRPGRRPARGGAGPGRAVLRAPGPDRDRELRARGSREPRRLRRGRWLRGPPQGALHDAAERGPGRDEGQPAARPWRRGLPDRPEVEHGGQGRRQPQVRHLQRRRGRPRRIHGPERPRERSASGPRGDGHRRLCGGGQLRVRLLPGRVPARGDPPAQGDPGGRPGRLPGRPDHGHRVLVRGRRPARCRGLRLRRGDRPDRLHRGWARDTDPAPTLSGRVRPVGPADADQQRRDLRQHRADRPQRRRVVRRDRHGDEQGDEGLRARWPHRQHRPGRGPDGHDPPRDRVRHRWRDRRRARRSRRSRRAVRPVAASPPSSWTCRSTTSRCSGSARSWARAA